MPYPLCLSYKSLNLCLSLWTSTALLWTMTFSSFFSYVAATHVRADFKAAYKRSDLGWDWVTHQTHVRLDKYWSLPGKGPTSTIQIFQFCRKNPTLLFCIKVTTASSSSSSSECTPQCLNCLTEMCCHAIVLLPLHHQYGVHWRCELSVDPRPDFF